MLRLSLVGVSALTPWSAHPLARSEGHGRPCQVGLRRSKSLSFLGLGRSSQSFWQGNRSVGEVKFQVTWPTWPTWWAVSGSKWVQKNMLIWTYLSTTKTFPFHISHMYSMLLVRCGEYFSLTNFESNSPIYPLKGVEFLSWTRLTTTLYILMSCFWKVNSM